MADAGGLQSGRGRGDTARLALRCQQLELRPLSCVSVQLVLTVASERSNSTFSRASCTVAAQHVVGCPLSSPTVGKAEHTSVSKQGLCLANITQLSAENLGSCHISAWVSQRVGHLML